MSATADYPAGKALSNPSPDRTPRRLSGKQSRQMERRLRDLCAAGMFATEIRKTVNGEMGIDWTLQAYYTRVRRLDLPWIRACAYCGVRFVPRCRGKRPRLKYHSADCRRKARREQDRKKHRKYLLHHRDDALRSHRESYARHRDDRRRKRREYHQTALSRVTAEQLLLSQSDFQREARLKLRFVVCRECGAKLNTLHGTRGGHLFQIHKMTHKQYNEKWPGAPLMGTGCLNAIGHRWAGDTERRKRYSERLTGVWAERKRKLAEVEHAPALVSKTTAKRSGGRPAGMETQTKEEAQELIRLMQEFDREKGTHKGAMLFASRKVYGVTVESRKAVARGNKTVQKYKAWLRNNGTKLPV